MADDQSTAANRLQEIWRQVEIAPGPNAAPLLAAIPKLEAWLAGGVQSAETVLRAVQCLLADPEVAGIGRRLPFDLVWKQISTEWPGAGTASDHPLLAQAMLIACWPKNKHEGGFAITPLLDPAFELQERTGRHLKLIDLWRKTVGQPPVGATGSLDLLWWGQARYSTSARKPFRGMELEQTIFLVTSEAVLRSTLDQVSPVSAYVAEILHALGHLLTERRSLHQWMIGLHRQTWRPTKWEVVSKLVDQDSLGLPCLAALRNASHQPLAEGGALSDHIRLPLDKEISLAQWADWLLRESLLCHALRTIVPQPAKG